MQICIPLSNAVSQGVLEGHSCKSLHFQVSMTLCFYLIFTGVCILVYTFSQSFPVSDFFCVFYDSRRKDAASQLSGIAFLFLHILKWKVMITWTHLWTSGSRILSYNHTWSHWNNHMSFLNQVASCVVVYPFLWRKGHLADGCTGTMSLVWRNRSNNLRQLVFFKHEDQCHVLR